MTRKCAVAAIAIMLASVCCAPVQAQIDFRVLDKYRGHQRPTVGNANHSSGQKARDQNEAVATAENQEGLAAENKGDWATADVRFRKALEAAPSDPVILQNLAMVQTHEGGDAYRRGDYVTALRFFQQALANDPASDTEGRESISRNLTFLQAAADSARLEQEQRQQARVNAARMEQDIRNLAQSLSAAPSSSGLDFARTETGNNSRPSGELTFSDPSVVDARNVPTGLPRSVSAEIPDTPAGNRVRKGFQAIIAHDWSVAHAWFGDALYHDPGNAGIQRLIELAEYTMARERHPSTLAPPRTAPAGTRVQDKVVIATLGTNLDNKMDADLASAFDDFNRNYLPKHPGLMNSMPSKGASAPALKPESEATSAHWRVFFGTLFVAALSSMREGIK